MKTSYYCLLFLSLALANTVISDEYECSHEDLPEEFFKLSKTHIKDSNKRTKNAGGNAAFNQPIRIFVHYNFTAHDGSLSQPSQDRVRTTRALGRPVDNPADVDYVPTVFAYKARSSNKKRAMLSAKKRAAIIADEKVVDEQLAAEGLLLSVNETEVISPTTETQTEMSSIRSVSVQTSDLISKQSVSVQTASSADLLIQTMIVPQPVPYCLPATNKTPLSIIEDDDEATKFNTGLPSWSSFRFVLKFIYEFQKHSPLCKLSQAESLLLTLMRLRLNLSITDLSYRFSISSDTAGRVFQNCIQDLFVNWKCLIKWPSQEIARQNLPPSFAELYPNTRCIIDCSEVFIEQPYGYTPRTKTYSNYKKHNTIKFLIGVTPNGSICFLSKCWGGRASDRCITINSGLLNLLSSGDTVLADRGFTLTDDLAVFGAKLEIPAFTYGKKQLSIAEVEQSKRLSKVRIHVERVIGLLKLKYTILQGKLPINLLKRKNDCNYAFIDKIVTVCCALTNLSPSIVPY
uniref:DDE Tnp4 domain-containing protein n=1 Tax=Amphimedon queenslandica TaxID=400682 RepID=A0A1X7T0A2_AMPQE